MVCNRNVAGNIEKHNGHADTKLSTNPSTTVVESAGGGLHHYGTEQSGGTTHAPAWLPHS